MYAEYAPSDVRGRLLILQQSFWAIGCTLNALIAWITLELLDWRWYLLISSFPLCFILIFALRLPQSVRYLVTVNKIEKAEHILNNALAQNKGSQNKGLQIKLVEPEQGIVINKRGNFKEIFNAKYFRTTILLFNILNLTVFSYYGISFVSERFFDEITESNNESNNEKYWKVVVTTSSEIPGVLLAMLTLDRYGRKNTLIANFAIFSITTLLLMDNTIQNNIGLSVSLAFFSRMCISISFFSFICLFQ